MNINEYSFLEGLLVFNNTAGILKKNKLMISNLILGINIIQVSYTENYALKRAKFIFNLAPSFFFLYLNLLTIHSFILQYYKHLYCLFSNQFYRECS